MNCTVDTSCIHMLHYLVSTMQFEACTTTLSVKNN